MFQHYTSDCLQGHTIDIKLGKGEQGVAYSMRGLNREGRNLSNTVLKVSDFGSQQVANVWKREVDIGIAIGNAGIAPQIYKAWTCMDPADGPRGYILMERMKASLRDMISNGKTPDGDPIDHINMIPANIMNDYGSALMTMIQMGYIHMDNHPGNLGVVNRGGVDKGVVFDFGFTVQRSDLANPVNQQLAFGFSLGQILEHAPLAEVLASSMFTEMQRIYNQLGIPIPFNQLPNTNITQIKAKYPKNTGISLDLYIGFMLFCRILQIEQPARFDDAYYDIIYYIRQGRFNPASPTRPLNGGGRRRANVTRRSRKDRRLTRRNRR